MIISLILNESEFFEWAALHVEKWGGGKDKLLFSYIILLGANVTAAALFANDGVALILTPIVIAMLLTQGFSKGTTLAFVMAVGFIADSVKPSEYSLCRLLKSDITEYASVMVPADIAAIIATLAILHVFFAGIFQMSMILQNRILPHRQSKI